MQTLTEEIKVRVSANLKQRIERAAKRQAITPSTFIRCGVERLLADLESRKAKHPKEGF